MRQGFGRAEGLALGAGLLIAAGGYAGLRPHREAIVAQFETSLAERTHNQRHNAHLSALKLDGAVIGPGQTFSFNAHVGTFSRDEGYRRAPVSYNGQLVNGWGGGVCQTSTTFYNAALLGGLEIVERSRHRFHPSYVPPGRDAAVAFGHIDLKVRNPYAFPIRIEAGMTGDRLFVRMLGAHKGPSVRLVSQILGHAQPATIAIAPARQNGRVRNTGKDGFEVAVYRIAGEHRELISMDRYPTMHRVIDFAD